MNIYTETFLTFSFLVVFLIFVLYLLMQIIKAVMSQSFVEEPWLLRFCVNIAGYSCILVPGFVAYKYVKASQYLDRTGKHRKYFFQ